MYMCTEMGTAQLADLQSEHKQDDREGKLIVVNCRQLLYAFLPRLEPDILVPVWCRAQSSYVGNCAHLACIVECINNILASLF